MNRAYCSLRQAGTAALLIASALVTGACDDLLDVQAPSRVPFELLEDPANADLLVTSLKTDLECAFGSYIVAGGLIGDELQDSQLAAALWSYDRRSFTAAGGQYATSTCIGGQLDIGVYTPLSTAIFLADTAASILASFSDADVTDRALKIATANAYSGFGVLLLGEAMCSGAIAGGSELTSQQLFAEAENRFTAALSGADADISALATQARARARLNQGDTGGALSDAQSMAPGTVVNAIYGTADNRSSNKLWVMNINSPNVTVENDFRNLSVNADGTHGQGGATIDPRVVAQDEGRLGQDQTTQYWTQRKYVPRDTPIPLARYAEAQLIIAEIELGQTAVDVINVLHADAGIPAWVPNDVNDDAEVMAHVIEERDIELYLESQHYFSKRRLNQPISPATGQPFIHGGFYGDQPCLPLPDQERLNNPNI